MLDFGCGYGTLVAALNGPRVHCDGFETSQRRLEFLRSRNLPVLAAPEMVRSQAPYDAVILSDVLEHVPEPGHVLCLCVELLAPGGLLCVHVPDFGDRRLAREMAAAQAGLPFTRELNPWEHLNYFSTNSLSGFIRKHGLAVLPDADGVNIGLRAGLRSWRRLANSAKSLLRLARHAIGLRPTDSTCVLAVKPLAIGLVR